MFVRCRNMHSHIKSTSLDLKMRLSYRQMHLSVKRSTPAGFRIGSARAITPWSPRKPRTPRGPPHAEAFLCVFELGSDSALTLGKLWRIRSWLCRGRYLQLNAHFISSFQKNYNTYVHSHYSELQCFGNVRQTISHFLDKLLRRS